VAHQSTTSPTSTRQPPLLLADLDAAHDRWVAGVQQLGEEGLQRSADEAEGPYAAYPLASLVLHIHREVIHHGAEILLLRDLYRSRPLTG